MAVAARAIERKAVVRPHLTLIPGTVKTAQKKSPSRSSVESVYRDVLRVVTSILVVGVIIGMGMVWLTTEAARLSKETDIIRQDIKREADMTQQLEMTRYQVASAQQLDRVATEALGMVPVNGDVTVVDVGGASPTISAAASSGPEAADLAPIDSSSSGGWVAQLTSGETLGRIAELTSGEAQVLLVGDIGLTAAR